MATITSADNRGCVKLSNTRANSSTGLYLIKMKYQRHSLEVASGQCMIYRLSVGRDSGRLRRLWKLSKMRVTSQRCLLVVVIALHQAASSSAAIRSLESNVQTWTPDVDDSIHRDGRRRREVSSMNDDEIRQVVDFHNALRASEGASDMEQMVYHVTIYSKTHLILFIRSLRGSQLHR